MPAFQVLSRTTQMAAPPQKKHRRFRPEWFAVIRFVLATSGAAGLFVLLTFFKGSNNAIFILLPVLIYLAVIQFQSFNLKVPVFVFNLFFNNTPLYLLVTTCFAFAYYGGIIGIELLLHQTINSHIILISTALTWAIMLDPLRVYCQRYIERRFNLRDREGARAIETFTSTLRQEIDLDQLCERFLAVIQQALKPYSVSLWLRIFREQREKSGATEEVVVAGDDPLMTYVLNHSGPLEIDRLMLDSPALQELKQSMAELLLPLACQGELIGLLILGPHLKGEAYTGEERATLAALAPQVAPALRVAQMVQEQQVEVRERERIEQELRTAQMIQRTFLPKEVPSLPGWRLVPYYQPAREVGGDFYDFLVFDDHRLGIVIGDVTDKGIPAALVMTATRTMLRTAAQELASPGEVLARVNDLLYEEIPPAMFVTCFYAILDSRSGQLLFANAGHEPPYRRCDGSASELWATGMPLGMMPGSRYEEQEATLAPGESLLFFSDGLVEAHNPANEMFSFPRLKAVLEVSTGGVSLINYVLSELKRFTGDGWEQEDDVTLVELQRTPHTTCEEEKGAREGTPLQ
jgi:serine phosphatase RsbU (regulator of sigma subunit)